MSQFNKSVLAFSVSAALTGLTATSAVAQEAAENADNEVTEVIQVRGIRGSLQRAQAIKMEETSFVEVLSAEDIGKLPDTSIAESLARLPGLAGERRAGRVSGLSVRGFNENYIGTTLNGRELLGMGDNRGVEFDLYPAEIVSTAVVYKTAEAGLMVQGIGGTVDLQTIKPLSAESTLTVNGRFEQNQIDSLNPDFDDNGHLVSLNFVDQFADDTIGVALVVASQETPRQEEQFRGWGYPTVGPQDADAVDVPADTAILGGHDSFARSAMIERDSIAAIIEWAPSDDLSIQLDALYIDFVENDARRGLEEGGPVWGPNNYSATDVQDGLVTAAIWDGFHSVVRNDVREQDSELTTFGLNIEYNLNDDWALEVDLSTGKVDKSITDVESYSGVGRAGLDGRPLTPRSIQLGGSHGWVFGDHPTLPGVDLTDPNLVRLAGPQGWGGALNPVSTLANAAAPGADLSTAQDGFVNQPVFDEELDAVRVEVDGLVEWGFINNVKAGVIYSDRQKTKVNNGQFLTAPSFFDPNGPTDAPIPEVLGVADLSFLGINGVLAYDSLGLFNSGYYTATDAALIENGRFGDTYTIEEEIINAYAKFDLEHEVGDMLLTGNFGLQVIDVDQFARGFNTTTGVGGFTSITPTEGGDSYTDVLPTLNLRMEVADGQFVRLAAGKVVSRPRMDDMRPNNQITFNFNDGNIIDTDPVNGPWGGSAGNPMLQPLKANQFDLGYENYFADAGYFSVSFFYKDLKNWHREGAAVADFSNEYIPGFHQTSGNTDINGDGVLDANDIVGPGTFLGGISFREDGLQGFVRGWEAQLSLPFEVLHESLEGFGMFASGTWMDGELDDGGQIPGLSRDSYSLTTYYENSGFEFRVAAIKRTDFLTEERGLSLALVNANRGGTTFVDAQIGYDFSESDWEALHGLRVTLQGQNLTDEFDTSTADDGRQILTNQRFGRNFILGLNYQF